MDEVAIFGDLGEATMGSKDKGGRNTKTAAAHNLKQKRQAKKDKKAGGVKSGFSA
jgi:hypothetical protein